MGGGRVPFAAALEAGRGAGMLRHSFFVLRASDWREEQRLQGCADEIRFPEKYRVFERYLKQRLEDYPLFMRVLNRKYELAVEFESFPEALRRLFAPCLAPHDWLYPFPTMRMYRRR